MKQECQVCMHHCNLAEGQTGICRARKNVAGKIVSINYGKLTSIALDPIEKKPLARFFPGSMILSVGSFGCNLRCPFCQNFRISMSGEEDIDYREVTPQALAELAEGCRDKGNIGVAFTYNEPLVSYEFVRDTAQLVHALGMKTVLVTNGSACEEIAREVLPHIDALNIDLKGIRPEYYKMLGGDLATVQAFIRRANETSHVELTNLVVTNANDSEEEMEELSSWVAAVNPEIPLHVTRFFPRYNMVDRDATPAFKIFRLAKIAARHLKWVYTGNV